MPSPPGPVVMKAAYEDRGGLIAVDANIRGYALRTECETLPIVVRDGMFVCREDEGDYELGREA